MFDDKIQDHWNLNNHDGSPVREFFPTPGPGNHNKPSMSSPRPPSIITKFEVSYLGIMKLSQPLMFVSLGLPRTPTLVIRSFRNLWWHCRVGGRDTRRPYRGCWRSLQRSYRPLRRLRCRQYWRHMADCLSRQILPGRSRPDGWYCLFS